LLFTAAPAHRIAVRAAARDAGVAVSCIGRIESGSQLCVIDGAGRVLDESAAGFDHFKT
jgi:thiamine-monophosphate kinase